MKSWRQRMHIDAVRGQHRRSMRNKRISQQESARDPTTRPSHTAMAGTSRAKNAEQIP
jgi:hypothetical protein